MTRFETRLQLRETIAKLLLSSPESGAQWAYICLLQNRLIAMGDVSDGPRGKLP